MVQGIRSKYSVEPQIGDHIWFKSPHYSVLTGLDVCLPSSKASADPFKINIFHSSLHRVHLKAVLGFLSQLLAPISPATAAGAPLCGTGRILLLPYALSSRAFLEKGLPCSWHLPLLRKDEEASFQTGKNGPFSSRTRRELWVPGSRWVSCFLLRSAGACKRRRSIFVRGARTSVRAKGTWYNSPWATCGITWRRNLPSWDTPEGHPKQLKMWVLFQEATVKRRKKYIVFISSLVFPLSAKWGLLTLKAESREHVLKLLLALWALEGQYNSGWSPAPDVLSGA